MNLFNFLFKVTLFILGTMIVGCTGISDDDPIPDFLERNNINAQQSGSGLYYDIINEGAGPSVMANSFILFHIIQYDIENNIILRTDDTPFPVARDVSTLIPGIIEGAMFLKKGGRALILIPPNLSGGTIQTGALIYTIEIIDIFDSLGTYNDIQITTYLNDNNLEAERMDNGLYVIIDEPGADPKPDISSELTIHYHGYLLNGDVFDSSIDRGVAATFLLAEVIEGWQLGIPLFGSGGKGTIFIPSNLAYGADGRSNIPGNYPLAFDVELISF